MLEKHFTILDKEETRDGKVFQLHQMNYKNYTSSVIIQKMQQVLRVKWI